MAEPPGAALRLWLAAMAGSAPLARWHLRRRRARGREDPQRMHEKEGIASAPRPDGPLVWMHAVGVGEVLALPALAEAMRDQHPALEVLVTSSSRRAAQALAPNLPAGMIHQYAPLDASRFVARFLDHWRPDLAVWAERDLWPGLVFAADRRGVPLAMVNGRLTDASARAKGWAGGLYGDLLARFSHIGAQDAASADRFRRLGARAVTVSGPLKAGAAPLADQPAARARLAAALAGRRIWVAASTHRGDEPAIAEAQRRLSKSGALLVAAPRDPARAEAVTATLNATGLVAKPLGPENALPAPPFDALVIGEMGQLGLWFRLAEAAFIGGSIAEIGGHNPYEPARLDCAVLHGPNVANFARDYAAFHAAGAAREVADGAALAEALADPTLAATIPAAAELAGAGAAALQVEAARLLDMMPRGADGRLRGAAGPD